MRPSSLLVRCFAISGPLHGKTRSVTTLCLSRQFIAHALRSAPGARYTHRHIHMTQDTTQVSPVFDREASSCGRWKRGGKKIKTTRMRRGWLSHRTSYRTAGRPIHIERVGERGRRSFRPSYRIASHPVRIASVQPTAPPVKSFSRAS